MNRKLASAVKGSFRREKSLEEKPHSAVKTRRLLLITFRGTSRSSFPRVKILEEQLLLYA